ncbi:MAG TPA: fumarylacetoacetate hydrolase family protein [Bryobacteraceae bacterium]
MIEDVVGLLSEARSLRKRVPGVPDEWKPADTRGAYEIQRALSEHWASSNGGFAGFKIACTSEIPQRQLGLSEPFFGRLIRGTVYESPLELDASRFFMRVIEPEFGFQISRDLRDGNYTAEDMAASVAGVVPGIEIVDSRYDDWEKVGAHSLIIDNACHGGWLHGAMSTSFEDLAEHRVRLLVNGREVTAGKGSAVLGHPLKALAWLANTLPQYGLALQKGDWVTTGVVTGLYYAQAGDEVVANFGPLGDVRVTFR